MNRSVLAVALAALVLLAGCASGVPNGIDGTTESASASDGGSVGQMNFYVSDERNAIGDFEHLNVTITSVGFQEAGGNDGDDAAAADAADDDDESYSVTVDGNVSAGANVTVIVTNETGVPVENATVTVNDEPVGQTDADGRLDVTLPDEDDIEIEVESEMESDDDETEAEADDETETTSTTEVDEESEDDDDSAGWVERDVDNATVDLTELEGANASLLAQFDVPTGEYTGAMVYISEVNATLQNGEHVNVKLPSEKLHVNTPFTVGDGEEVDFVFDITVKKAGNSGKYVLRPVVSESGKNIEMNVVDDEGDDGDSDEDDAYNVTVDGNVSAGEQVTVTVTDAGGEPVRNATVEVNGEVAGETDADGQLEVTVPDADELEIEVETDEGEGELELELAADSDADDSDADAAEAEGDDGDDEPPSDAGLTASFTNNVTAGSEATLLVTNGDGDGVVAAVVEVNGESVGKTGSDGSITFDVPADVETLEIEVEKGSAEYEFEVGVGAAADT